MKINSIIIANGTSKELEISLKQRLDKLVNKISKNKNIVIQENIIYSMLNNYGAYNEIEKLSNSLDYLLIRIDDITDLARRTLLFNGYVAVSFLYNKIYEIDIFHKYVSQEEKDTTFINIDGEVKNLYDTLMEWKILSGNIQRIVRFDNLSIDYLEDKYMFKFMVE